MPTLEGWDLDRYRVLLRARAAKLRIDPRILVREDESDLVQETILRAIASQEPIRCQSDSERLAWLMKIQDRLYRDLLKEHHAEKRDIEREQRFQNALDESKAEWLLSLHDAQPQPSEVAARNEESELLQRGLLLLPDREREAMTLQVNEHLSLQEIADRLKTTKPTIAGLIGRGTIRLADIIAGLRKPKDT